MVVVYAFIYEGCFGSLETLLICSCKREGCDIVWFGLRSSNAG